jgi:xanthine/uracil permease
MPWVKFDRAAEWSVSLSRSMYLQKLNLALLVMLNNIPGNLWLSHRGGDRDNIEAGVRADGMGCIVGGLLGTPGMSASPSPVSVAKTTGASSRVIALSIAGWLVVLCCLPKLAGLIVNMPRPVMAAALFFNGAMMFVAGIQIASSRPMDAAGHVGDWLLDFGGDYCAYISSVVFLVIFLATMPIASNAVPRRRLVRLSSCSDCEIRPVGARMQ